MRNSHKKAFFYAAEKFSCWIGLREPNPLSDKWIGKAGFRPKDHTCKAKTADNGFHMYSGLVVDPTICPEAFLPNTLHDAINKWNRKFLVDGGMPAGFSRVEKGSEKGLVKQNGKAIYADYDLMAIVKSDDHGNFLFTDQKEAINLFEAVANVVNMKIGIPLIQHGSEFTFSGLGARSVEYILWFGPNRRFKMGISSMPEKGH